jgi:ArsR family transcriptional regulator, arsenate/arsenite/antimonite-responsive transcriptional repressor
MEMTSAVDALGALAQESRLSVFRLLVQHAPGGLPAGTIAERLGVAPATLSHHLQQLSYVGLVRSTRHGRSIVYTANIETMQQLLAFLTENCCQGKQECLDEEITRPCCGPEHRAVSDVL